MVMRVFVAGGAGVVGRRLVPQLVARGHQVTATATGAAGRDVVEQLGAEGVVMDGLDAASVGAAVAAARPDTIVHEMTAIGERQYPLVGTGAGYSSWVHVDDAASATVLAVEQRARGVFNIVDDEPAPAREWLPWLAASAGAKRPMRIPAWLVRPLAGEAAVIMMTEGRGFSNAKAKRELGWKLRYSSWRQGFREGLG